MATTINTKLASGMTTDGAHVRALLTGNAQAARQARREKAEDASVDLLTVRVVGDFMNFYRGDDMVGIVDRRTIFGEPGALATRSFGELPTAAFERAARRRVQVNAAARKAGC